MMVTKPPLNNPSKEKELHVVGLIKSSEKPLYIFILIPRALQYSLFSL